LLSFISIIIVDKFAHFFFPPGSPSLLIYFESEGELLPISVSQLRSPHHSRVLLPVKK